MRHLSHECVVKLFEVVDAPTLLYLVMEHAPCGSLLDYVRGRKRLTETDAVTVVQQIVAGLSYCHQREVVHRWAIVTHIHTHIHTHRYLPGVHPQAIHWLMSLCF